MMVAQSQTREDIADESQRQCINDNEQGQMCQAIL